MTSLAAKVIAFCRSSAVFTAGERVALAVSGGPDSVALAWLLDEARPSLGIELAGLVHVHHGIRGAEADADLALAHALSAELGLPWHAERVDVPAIAAARNWSIERAGHLARHAAYRRAADALRATAVATGHTRGDLAETFLLRALRGASRRGLAGMAPRRGLVARPLLDTTRDALLAYLEGHGRTYRHDATNDDDTIARNRLRRQVLPSLAAAFPGAERALARTARMAADDEAALEAVATEWAARFVSRDGEVTRVDRGALLGLLPAIARRVLRRVFGSSGAAGHQLAQLDAVLRLAKKRRGRLQYGGLSVDNRDGALEVVQPVPGPRLDKPE